MHFDVPKLVRSPGYDHGHDEESRKGRDIKIDILDDYVWTSEWFRVSSGIYRSTGGLSEPPGSQWALLGPSGREEEATRWRAPPKPNPNWVGGRPPLLPPSSPFLPLLVQLGRGRGILLPVGVGLLQAHPKGAGRTSPSLLYIWGQGAPHNTQVDLRIVP